MADKLQDQVNAMQKEFKSMKHEIERLQAYVEIQNLVAKYEVVHTPSSMSRSVDLFALKQPDVSVEIAMWGKMTGPDKVKKMFTGMSEGKPKPGGMFEHNLTTPVIQVAADGKTAKGLWFSPGHETTRDEKGNLIANWCWGKFGADFIKEDGKWKIWHYHWYDTFFSPYYKSWVDFPQPGLDVILTPKGMTAEPPTCRSSYFPDQVRKPIPDYPEPYETWDGKSVCY